MAFKSLPTQTKHRSYPPARVPMVDLSGVKSIVIRCAERNTFSLDCSSRYPCSASTAPNTMLPELGSTPANLPKP